MILSKLTENDIGVCVNYVVDEYSKLSENTKGLAQRIEYAIEDKLGWKVEKDGVVLGFAVVEEFGDKLLVTSLVVGKEYRAGKTTWMLFKQILEEAGNRGLVYIPIHKDMWASKLCKDGKIDKVRAQEWVDKLAKRW